MRFLHIRRHDMIALSALAVFCEDKPSMADGFPVQRDIDDGYWWILLLFWTSFWTNIRVWCGLRRHNSYDVTVKLVVKPHQLKRGQGQYIFKVNNRMKCVSKFNFHWLKNWLVTCSAPSHCWTNIGFYIIDSRKCKSINSTCKKNSIKCMYEYHL